MFCVGIQPSEFLVRGCGDDPVHAMLVGADQVCERTDLDIKAVQPSYFVLLGNEIGLLEHVAIHVGAIEEGPNFWLRHCLLACSEQYQAG